MIGERESTQAAEANGVRAMLDVPLNAWRFFDKKVLRARFATQE
jgi:hypothetical protein